MKLNLTKSELGNLTHNPDLTLIIGSRDYMREALSDLTTLHAEVEAQATLIEQLEKALLIRDDGWCPACGQTKEDGHSDDCIVGLALLAVEAWRGERSKNDTQDNR